MSSTATTGGWWGWFEDRRALAFLLSGALVLASGLSPVVVGPFVDRPWAVGLPLVGLAVLAVAAGLVGLYPQLRRDAPWSARAGLVFAAVAGFAAAVMIALAAAGYVSDAVLGQNPEPPIQLFKNVSLAMAAGYAFGLLAFGIAGLRTELPTRTVGRLLLAGGLVFSVPVVLELLGFVADVAAPAWTVFLAMLIVAFDVIAVGYSLRSRAGA
ncbi:hypothetical protein BRC81_11375 [Halobacteriales archaeon QS_1_68_20]|nr:MAG: hypothetical protein BRC81_11375 [Halobacteriales archaeon QS_1_68_20]